MKDIAKIGLIGGVVFVAALGALQVDRMMRNPSAAGPESVEAFLASNPVRTVDFESGQGAPADFRAAVAKLKDSVVSVDRLDERYNLMGRSVGLAQTGTGSGVIISGDGYILTNNHVVEEADKVLVRLPSDENLEATVVGTDPRSDLAVLKVTTKKKLTPAIQGDSGALQPGEWVIAIGNPLGYSNTVSVGVVSSLNRTLQTGRNTLLVDGIQTDAAINQGNSGGALANAKGELVGINSAIVSNSGGSIGLGFAIPINRAKRVVDEIIKTGRVRYGTLGVSVVDYPSVLKNPRARYEIESLHGAAPPEQGLWIRQVSPNSAAAKLGVKDLDIITQINNQVLNLPIDLTKALIDKRPGDKVRLTYWSKGQKRTVEASLQEP